MPFLIFRMPSLIIPGKLIRSICAEVCIIGIIRSLSIVTDYFILCNGTPVYVVFLTGVLLPEKVWVRIEFYLIVDHSDIALLYL